MRTESTFSKLNSIETPAPSVISAAGGFGGLIAFLIAAAAGTIVQLDRVRAADTNVRQAFLSRLRSLEQIRSEIYLSGMDVRDYLLSEDAAAGSDGSRSRIAGIEQQTRTALDAYSHDLDPEEKASFLELRSGIDAYWQIIEAAFRWTPEQRRRQRYTFFLEQLVPRRTTMLQIADSIAAINERGLNRAEDRFTASAVNLRWGLLLMFGVALAGGTVLAAGTITLTLRLEREVERRLEETALARSDLEDLSARLDRAQEDERRALARELHDEVGQSLSAIMMEAGNVELADEKSRRGIASILATAGATLNAVRDLALLLRPSMLDDFGLVPALNWHAREIGKRTGLSIRIAADDSWDDLPDEHRTCIYRVVQEALQNAVRHAGARNVQIAVKRETGAVVFSVQDDGVGFDKRVVRGLGLLGMEERVRRLGGLLRLDSRAGRGTTIVAELPLTHLSFPENREAYAANSHSAR